jgi:hypothetical protein
MKTEDVLILGGVAVVGYWALKGGLNSLAKDAGAAAFNVPADLIGGFGGAFTNRYAQNYQAVTAAPQPEAQQFRQIQSNFFPFNVMTLFGVRW